MSKLVNKSKLHNKHISEQHMKSFIQTYCSNNYILQDMDPTSYYHPTAVPILWLYFDEAQ